LSDSLRRSPEAGGQAVVPSPTVKSKGGSWDPPFPFRS
jgi:hypothetical protein